MTARRERIFLVTGGSGLLGSRLVRRLLEEGQRVRVLDTRIGELRDIRTFMEASADDFLVGFCCLWQGAV